MFRCFTTYLAWVILGITVIAAGYLVVWHGTHVAAFLPFLVILACPLMHLFMHGHHGDHRKDFASSQSLTSGGSDETRKT